MEGAFRSPDTGLLPDRSPLPLAREGAARNYATTAFDRAAKLLRSFCSLGGITAMQ